MSLLVEWLTIFRWINLSFSFFLLGTNPTLERFFHVHWMNKDKEKHMKPCEKVPFYRRTPWDAGDFPIFFGHFPGKSLLFRRFQDLDYEGVEDSQFLTPVRSSRGTIDVEGGPIQAPSSPWPEDRAEGTWPYEEYEEEDSWKNDIQVLWIPWISMNFPNENMICSWISIGNDHFIPTDEVIFFRGVGQTVNHQPELFRWSNWNCDWFILIRRHELWLMTGVLTGMVKSRSNLPGVSGFVQGCSRFQYLYMWLVFWNMNFIFFHMLGMSSSQLTKSYFSEG